MATNTASSTTTTNRIIRFDSSYIKTLPGILKLGGILCSLMGIGSCQSAWAFRNHSSFGWYFFVSMTAFWVSLLLLLCYLIHLVEKLHFFPWLLLELGFCGTWSIFYLITGIISSTNAPYDEAWAAGACFAFVAALLYGLDGLLKYIAWKAGNKAQGEVASSTVTQTSPCRPAY